MSAGSLSTLLQNIPMNRESPQHQFPRLLETSVLLKPLGLFDEELSLVHSCSGLSLILLRGILTSLTAVLPRQKKWPDRKTFSKKLGRGFNGYL